MGQLFAGESQQIVKSTISYCTVVHFTCSFYITCLSLPHLDSAQFLPSLIRVLRLFFFVLFSRPINTYNTVSICFTFTSVLLARKDCYFLTWFFLLDPSQKVLCISQLQCFLCVFFFQQKTPSFIGLRHLLIP